jgi:hypothetical protein
MQGDMIRPVALDLILGVVRAGVMGVTLVIDILRMHSDDTTGNAAGFGIPANVVTDLETAGHECLQRGEWPHVRDRNVRNSPRSRGH